MDKFTNVEYIATEEMKDTLDDILDRINYSNEDAASIQVVSEKLSDFLSQEQSFMEDDAEDIRKKIAAIYPLARVLYKATVSLTRDLRESSDMLDKLTVELSKNRTEAKEL